MTESAQKYRSKQRGTRGELVRSKDRRRAERLTVLDPRRRQSISLIGRVDTPSELNWRWLKTRLMPRR